MSVVSFTLSEEGVVSFQNALACILRFCETVALEAKKDKLVLSALNDTKSAFVSFEFSSTHFFRYKYEGNRDSPGRFYCSILIRALLSIFRNRTGGEAGRGGPDSSIERCDVSIDDGPGKRSRFVAKIAWRNGITATHAIPFEAKSPIVAKFDDSKVTNHWSISAHTLRRLMDHFGPKVELLDINTEGTGVLNLTCFTEKQYTKPDTILSSSLHTSIAVKMDDFDEFDVDAKHHVIISVRDFRALLQHACTTTGTLVARYSQPWLPLRFSYTDNGLSCQFVLTTLGEATDKDHSTKSNARMRNNTARPRLPSGPATSSSTPAEANRPTPVSGLPRQATATTRPEFPSASATPSVFDIRPQPTAPSTMRMEALLDEDDQWDPVNPDEENPGFVQIEWDESLQPELTFVPINNAPEFPEEAGTADAADAPGSLEPTQRLTQVRKFGLFD